jgi:hypothetical protein
MCGYKFHVPFCRFPPPIYVEAFFLEGTGACWTLHDRRAGYRVYYRLVQSQDTEITQLFQYLLQAFGKDKALKADLKKLREAIKEGSCTVSEWKPMSGVAVRPQLEGA